MHIHTELAIEKLAKIIERAQKVEEWKALNEISQYYAKHTPATVQKHLTKLEKELWD